MPPLLLRSPRVRLALAALVPVLLGGCGLCGNEVVQRVPSPDGRLAAIVFTRDCGATTSYNTQVAIRRGGGERLPRRDVVFVADDDHGAAPSAPRRGPDVRLRWVDVRRLEIAHHPRVRIFRQKDRHRGVEVAYAVFAPLDSLMRADTAHRPPASPP